MSQKDKVRRNLYMPKSLDEEIRDSAKSLNLNLQETCIIAITVGLSAIKMATDPKFVDYYKEVNKKIDENTKPNTKNPIK